MNKMKPMKEQLQEISKAHQDRPLNGVETEVISRIIKQCKSMAREGKSTCKATVHIVDITETVDADKLIKVLTNDDFQLTVAELTVEKRSTETSTVQAIVGWGE